MRINEMVTLNSIDYDLRGIIYHKGSTPHRGHYVAVARHGGDVEPFFVYNDDHRQNVQRSVLACDMVLPGSWQSEVFHATALLYERGGMC